MPTIDLKIELFIINRIPYFAYDKYYLAYFTGKSEFPPSVWISTVVEDWFHFRATLKETDISSAVKKMDQFCSMLEDFLLNYGVTKKLDDRRTYANSDWLSIVYFAKNFYKL